MPHSASADRLTAYRTAHVRLGLPGGDVLLVPADGPGRFPLDGPAHVLTAHNPGPVLLDAGVNADRNARLVADLRARGHVVHPTVAHDAAGGHREEGVLVVGLTDDDARRLGRVWGQDAVFGWTPSAWTVLPCAAGRPLAGGWRLDVAPGSLAPHAVDSSP